MQVALLTEQYTRDEIEQATGMSQAEIKAALSRVKRVRDRIERDADL